MRQKFRGLYDTITNSLNPTQQQSLNGPSNETSENINDETVRDDSKVKISVETKSKSNTLTKDNSKDMLEAEVNESTINLTGKKRKQANNSSIEKAEDDNTSFRYSLKEKTEAGISKNISEIQHSVSVGNDVDGQILETCTNTETLGVEIDEKEFPHKKDFKQISLPPINEDVSREISTNKFDDSLETSQEIQDSINEFEKETCNIEKDAEILSADNYRMQDLKVVNHENITIKGDKAQPITTDSDEKTKKNTLDNDLDEKTDDEKVISDTETSLGQTEEASNISRKEMDLIENPSLTTSVDASSIVISVSSDSLKENGTNVEVSNNVNIDKTTSRKLSIESDNDDLALEAKKNVSFNYTEKIDDSVDTNADITVNTDSAENNSENKPSETDYCKNIEPEIKSELIYHESEHSDLCNQDGNKLNENTKVMLNNNFSTDDENVEKTYAQPPSPEDHEKAEDFGSKTKGSQKVDKTKTNFIEKNIESLVISTRIPKITIVEDSSVNFIKDAYKVNNIKKNKDVKHFHKNKAFTKDAFSEDKEKEDDINSSAETIFSAGEDLKEDQITQDEESNDQKPILLENIDESKVENNQIKEKEFEDNEELKDLHTTDEKDLNPLRDNDKDEELKSHDEEIGFTRDQLEGRGNVVIRDIHGKIIYKTDNQGKQINCNNRLTDLISQLSSKVKSKKKLTKKTVKENTKPIDIIPPSQPVEDKKDDLIVIDEEDDEISIDDLLGSSSDEEGIQELPHEDHNKANDSDKVEDAMSEEKKPLKKRRVKEVFVVADKFKKKENINENAVNSKSLNKDKRCKQKKRRKTKEVG